MKRGLQSSRRARISVILDPIYQGNNLPPSVYSAAGAMPLLGGGRSFQLWSDIRESKARFWDDGGERTWKNEVDTQGCIWDWMV